MKKLALYPTRQYAKLDFAGVERVTVPNQSMSLKEILIRFTRKQSLPVEQATYYLDKYGIDWSKVPNEDLVDKYELLRIHGERLKRMKEVLDKKAEEELHSPPEKKVDAKPPDPPVVQ